MLVLSHICVKNWCSFVFLDSAIGCLICQNTFQTGRRIDNRRLGSINTPVNVFNQLHSAHSFDDKSFN